MTARGDRLGLAALGGLYLVLAATLPAADDELYYWCWSRDLRPSYFDHPPLTAYLIRGSTALFGDSVLAIRLPACLAGVTVLGVVAGLTRSRALLPFIALTPVFTVGAVIISPDVPLLLFWALYLAWLVRLHGRLSAGRSIPVESWLLGGLLLGLGALGKYTMGLAVPAGLAAFLLAGRPGREWVPGYLLHGLVSLAVFSPVLAFNARAGFEPLLFQWRHAVQSDEPGGLRTFGEFVGLQVLLVGLLPLGLFPWVLARLRALAAEPVLRVCACLYAVPMAFFLVQSLRGPLEGNWALVCYLGFWPVAARWLQGIASPARRVGLAAAAFALPVASVLVLAAHLVHPLPFIPPEIDRVARQRQRIAMAEEVAREVRDRGDGVPVYVPTYQWTALLRYQGVDARQLDGISRPSQFTLRPEHLTDGDRAYMFTEGALPGEMTPGFGPPVILREYPLRVRGRTLATYFLILYTRTPTPQPSAP